jgi:hypothetical protein
MKSTLKIDLYSNNEPMITASVATDRSDLRDDVMNKFFDALKGNWDYPDNTQEESHLCFVEGFGRENSPEAYLHTIHFIRPGEEDRYMNRLQPSQAKRMIPLLFMILHGNDRRLLLKQLDQMDSKFLKDQKGNQDELPKVFKNPLPKRK